MTESTRALLYRFALLAVILYALVAHPDQFAEWVPVLIALGGNGLAAANTRITR